MPAEWFGVSRFVKVVRRCDCSVTWFIEVYPPEYPLSTAFLALNVNSKSAASNVYSSNFQKRRAL
jgi:hypothetical protein